MQPKRRWRPTRIHLVTALCGVLVGAGAIGIYWDATYLDWRITGFGPKTIWDWLELLVVPFFLAVAGLIYQSNEKKIERVQIAEREKVTRELATDSQIEAALQTYFDRMSDLIAEKDLGTFSPIKVRSIARARTLTVLERLDPYRRGVVIQFLYEANLINEPAPVISLQGANLQNTSFVAANLERVNLAGANLTNAGIRFSNLQGAILTRANLEGATLTGSNFIGADFVEAHLYRTVLFQSHLGAAKFLKAFLAEADLRSAKLGQTDFTHAVLLNANMLGAEAEHAYLSAAFLGGATLSDGTKQPMPTPE